MLNISYVQEQWFSPGSKSCPASGLIESRLKNYRCRKLSTLEKQEAGICKSHTNKELPKITGKEDSSLVFQQKRQWLKDNEFPPETVLQFMEDTYEGRRYNILNDCGGLEEILTNWPRLLHPTAVSICHSLKRRIRFQFRNYFI